MMNKKFYFVGDAVIEDVQTPLSRLQRTFCFIRDHVDCFQRPPTYRNLMDGLSMTKHAVSIDLWDLQSVGVLEFGDSSGRQSLGRSMRLVKDLPFLSQVEQSRKQMLREDVSLYRAHIKVLDMAIVAFIEVNGRNALAMQYLNSIRNRVLSDLLATENELEIEIGRKA